MGFSLSSVVSVLTLRGAGMCSMSLGSHAKPDASKWVVLAPPLPHRHCRVHRNGQHLRLCQLHAPGTGLSKGESPGKSTSHHLANQPPSAAVTNDHKLSGLKLHKWVPRGSIGQRSEVGPSNLRSMCPPGLSSFWRVQRTVSFLAFSRS